MKRSNLVRFAAAAIAALSIAAMSAACGDDDDDGGDTPTSAATTQAASSPTSAATTPAGGGESTVDVADNSFSPGELTIDAGTTVTWEWSGSNPHSVVGEFEGEEVDSGTLTGAGETFEFTFDTAGTFEYICAVHGDAMSGTVVVQ